MSDELIRELRQMQQYAAMLQGLLNEAQEKSPERSQGGDGAGAVSVVLDASGLPAEITVASDWPRRVEPAALGAAVLDAFGQAAQTRMQAWSASLEGGEWGTKVGRLMKDDDPVEQFSTTPMSDVPQMFRRDQAPVSPRPIGELTEEMIKAFDRVDEIAKESPAVQQYTGEDNSGKVTITLSQGGLSGCAINANWATDRSGPYISHALNEALSAARKRMRAQAGAPTAKSQLDSLLSEVMTLLNDPRRLAES